MERNACDLEAVLHAFVRPCSRRPWSSYGHAGSKRSRCPRSLDAPAFTPQRSTGDGGRSPDWSARPCSSAALRSVRPRTQGRYAAISSVWCWTAPSFFERRLHGRCSWCCSTTRAVSRSTLARRGRGSGRPTLGIYQRSWIAQSPVPNCRLRRTRRYSPTLSSLRRSSAPSLPVKTWTLTRQLRSWDVR